MAAEHHEEVPHPADVSGEYSFDELAKGMAQGTITRGRMLKLAGVALLGGILSVAFPGVAQARHHRHLNFAQRCLRAGGEPCSTPTGPVCCLGGGCEAGVGCLA